MFKYQNCQINYYDSKTDSDNVLVYLHGWGQNIEMMLPIAKPFEDKYRVIIIDLPGFGKSSEPVTAWELNDYASAVKSLLDHLKINNPILIGHSFGGKISLLYASLYEVKKLVLLAAPYKASTKKPNKKLALIKKLNKIPGMKHLENYIKKRVGSTDYRNATPTMRNILVKHVNTDLTDTARLVKCPTLLIWGTLDEHVPLSDAEELTHIMKDAGLVTYENRTHYAYLEERLRTIKILDVFFKDKGDK